MGPKTESRSMVAALEDAIKRWANSNLELFDVGLVVSVDKYSSDRAVSVYPLCVQKDSDGILIDKPIVSECPVVLQGTAKGVLHFPLQVGDKVILGYPKDSIEEFIYSKSTEPYIPVDSMKFQSRQAVVLGTVAQAGVDLELSPDSFEIKYHNSIISVSPEDVVTITNGESQVTLDGGSITANGATINSSGNVITASGTNLDSFKQEYDLHKHKHDTPNTGLPI